MLIMPPHTKDGVIVGMVQIDKEPRYVVSYTDKPHLRIGVKPQNILDWVSKPSYLIWKQDEIPQEGALAKIGAINGRRSTEDNVLAEREEGKLVNLSQLNMNTSQPTITTLRPRKPPYSHSVPPTSTSIGAHTKRPQTTSHRTLPAPADEEDNKSEWEVDQILKHEFRKEGRRKPHLYYYIRWAGDWDDSWQPKENVGSGVVAEYWQKKRRETQMMNPDNPVGRGSNDDSMYVDVNINSRGNRTRGGLDEEYESDKDSLFVGPGLSSRGSGLEIQWGKEVEAAKLLMMIRTTETQSVNGV